MAHKSLTQLKLKHTDGISKCLFFYKVYKLVNFFNPQKLHDTYGSYEFYSGIQSVDLIPYVVSWSKSLKIGRY